MRMGGSRHDTSRAPGMFLFFIFYSTNNYLEVLRTTLPAPAPTPPPRPHLPPPSLLLLPPSLYHHHSVKPKQQMGCNVHEQALALNFFLKKNNLGYA